MPVCESGHDVIFHEPWFYVGCGPGDFILYLVFVMVILGGMGFLSSSIL
jgi:hypothetical protein